MLPNALIPQTKEALLGFLKEARAQGVIVLKISKQEIYCQMLPPTPVVPINQLLPTQPEQPSDTLERELFSMGRAEE